MRHLHILCEGQTEEIIARDVMEPHLIGEDAWVTWSIFTTKRPAGGPAFKGGLSTWLSPLFGSLRRPADPQPSS